MKKALILIIISCLFSLSIFASDNKNPGRSCLELYQMSYDYHKVDVKRGKLALIVAPYLFFILVPLQIESVYAKKRAKTFYTLMEQVEAAKGNVLAQFTIDVQKINPELYEKEIIQRLKKTKDTGALCSKKIRGSYRKTLAFIAHLPSV